jgi:hypothetical protein
MVAFAVAACALGAPSRADAQPPAAGNAECVRSSHEALRLRKAGKLVDTRAELVRCAQSDCAPAVRRDCERRLRELDAQMPSVVVTARDESGHAVTDGTVLVDERAIASGLDGKPIPVDPGSHVVAVSRAGTTVRRTVLVRDKGYAVDLQLAPAPGAAAGPSSATSGAAPAASTREDAPSGHTAGPWVPIVAGGLLTTGSVVSLAGAKRDPSPGAFVAGAAGIVSLAGGIVWYLAESKNPSLQKNAPYITAGYGGALVVAGVVTGLARSSLPANTCEPTAADYRACVDDYHDVKVRRDGVVSSEVAFYLIGGASIAIGATWALLDDGKAKQTSGAPGTRVVVVPGGVAGTF